MPVDDDHGDCWVVQKKAAHLRGRDSASESALQNGCWSVHTMNLITPTRFDAHEEAVPSKRRYSSASIDVCFRGLLGPSDGSFAL